MSSENVEEKKTFVLTIDDDVDFNNYLSLVLRRLDLESKITTNVNEFLEALKQRTPDICLIDINLDIAIGAGFQLIKAIRSKIGYDIPIFIISKRNSEEDIAHGLEIGASDYIPKPLDDLTFRSKIDPYINKQARPNLPVFKVSSKNQPCEYTLSLQLNSISEFGISFKSPHLLAKGSRIHASGPDIEKIFKTNSKILLNVHKTSVCEDSRLFVSYCEFDFEDTELLTNVRNFLLANSYQP